MKKKPNMIKVFCHICKKDIPGAWITEHYSESLKAIYCAKCYRNILREVKHG